MFISKPCTNSMLTESFSWGLSLESESVSCHDLYTRINFPESQVSKSRYPGSCSWQTAQWCLRNSYKPHSSSLHSYPPPSQGACLLLAGFPGLSDLLSDLASKGSAAFHSTHDLHLLFVSVSLLRAASVSKR